MNQKERKQEEQELEKAVSVLRAMLRSIANRKAHRYEQDFLHRVRDIIDQEIDDSSVANELSADFTAREVKQEILKD